MFEAIRKEVENGSIPSPEKNSEWFNVLNRQQENKLIGTASAIERADLAESSKPIAVKLDPKVMLGMLKDWINKGS